MKENEIWKFVKETNSRRFGKRIYEASNTGKVRCNGVILPLSNFRKTKYYADPTRTESLLHRLIAKLFIPNPENKPCVDHINGNKHDNRVENLRWVTYKENMNNPLTIEIQRQAQKIAQSGEKNGMYNKHHTNKTKQLLRETQIDTIIINNGTRETHVKPEILNNYINNGWKIGRLPFKESHRQNIGKSKIGTYRVYHDDGTWHMEKIN